MKFTSVSLIFALFSLEASPARAYTNDSLSGTEYFSLFDYRDPTKTKRIRTFEAELIDHADQIIAYLKKYPDYPALRRRNETSASQLGLILVYTGMFILNTNNAILEGVFDAHTFDGVGARYEKAQTYLDLALKLAPEDDRIHSWDIANYLRTQKAETGKVSDETLDQVVALAQKNPIFHLFNALTMSSDYDFGPAREAELLKLTELMDSKDSPCGFPLFRTGTAKQCNTTHKTPFAFQGVTTYMGDEFLKTASRLMSADPTLSKTYAERALKNYKRIEFFLFDGKTRRWSLKENLDERIDLTQKFIDTGNFDANYFKSRQYLDLYTCMSCHQSGFAPQVLHVNMRFPE